jgi:hypothetical protein
MHSKYRVHTGNLLDYTHFTSKILPNAEPIFSHTKDNFFIDLLNVDNAFHKKIMSSAHPTTWL